MDHDPPVADRDQLRRWLANWRVVNETQDALTRAAPPVDSATCLALGVSMIDIALHLRRRHADVEERAGSEDHSVQQTWRRLRAAYGH